MIKQKKKERIKELETANENLNKNIKKLVEIGSSLSQEKNLNKLLEIILEDAKEFSSADAGTLYLMSDDERFLNFTVVQTDSLGIKMGGSSDPISWPALPLYLENEQPNTQMVAAMCALSGDVISIPDVYEAQGFNFEGTKKFDQGTGYRSKSMLVIPMRNHEDEIIGVLQLLNKKDKKGDTIEFDSHDEFLTLSFASQAAIAITNKTLIQGLETLLESFIKTTAKAIDAKSPYTGGHIKRMAELSMDMAKAINKDDTVFKDIHFSDDDLKQLRIAAWMHDIGKITTPEYVVDKSTKLETIYDRIHTVEAKIEILKRDKEISYLKDLGLAKNDEDEKILKDAYLQQIKELDEDLEFIKGTNIGGEFMADEKIERIERLSRYEVEIGGAKTTLLDDDEKMNLSIRKGTLNDWERDKINEHAKVSYDMLKSLPFPKKLRLVPEIAGGHHEKLDGTGYPRGLKEDEILFEGKLLALTDVFEALTAHDRPYKEAKKLSESMRILGFMVKDRHIDPKLTRFFYDSGLYLKYAKENLDPKLIDEFEPNF